MMTNENWIGSQEQEAKDAAGATDLGAAAPTPTVDGVEVMATSGTGSRSRQSKRKKSRSKSQEMDAGTKVAPTEGTAAKAAREKRAIQERDQLSFTVFYRQTWVRMVKKPPNFFIFGGECGCWVVIHFHGSNICQKPLPRNSLHSPGQRTTQIWEKRGLEQFVYN